jgi:hypothetical protein
MNKQRKWKAFIVLELLTQSYFIFGMLTQSNWWTATLALLLFYFGANVVEGSVGKEKNDKPVI